MRISAQAIKRPAGTIIMVVLLMILGVVGFMRLPVNLLPDITYPMVKVYVYWTGGEPATSLERLVFTG